MDRSSGLRRFLLPLTLLAALTAAAPPPTYPARFEAVVADAKAAMLADPKTALTRAADARALSEDEAEPRRRALMRATATWLEGEAHTRMGENARAEPLLDATVAIARRHAPGSRLEGDALLSRGSARAAVGKVGGAMTDLHAAHDIFRALGDPRSRARAFTLIATLYYDPNDGRNALRYFGEALEVYRADPGLAVAIHNGRGITLRDMKRYEAARAEFDKALTLARDLRSPPLIATILNNLARVALATNDVGNADRAIAESMALARSAGVSIQRQQALAAQSALQRGDTGRAAALSDAAFAGIDLTKTTLADREAHRTAYEAYRALRQSEAALAHLTAWKRLDDEATDLARSNSASLMAARFDFANQELRIANLKAADLQKSVAFERSRARTQRIVLASGLGIAIVVFAMLVFGIVTIRRSRDKVRAANLDLESTNVALNKALAAKTEFLATTSHEIRTPLNGILGMTQVMLADPGVAGPTRDRVGLVHSAGVTMRALVDDILDVAKMETGKLSVEAIPFDLPATITDATRMWREQAEAKGLRFTLDLGDAPQRIEGDPSRLRQIVFNLLSNAIKFTASGAVTITARRLGDRYRIAVTDTGIGIDPAQHALIFEPFSQADSGTTRQFGGTGLGLSICRNLAEAMGGTVSVQSAAGEGATFSVDLPLVELAEMPAVSPCPDAAAACDVLIVDRNPITRAMLSSLVQPRASAVTGVARIEEAVAALGGHRFATVLIDDATLRAAEDPAGAVARIVAVAADARVVALWPAGEPAIHIALRTAGADDVIGRPVARDALIARLFDEAATAAERAPLVTRAA